MSVRAAPLCSRLFGLLLSLAAALALAALPRHARAADDKAALELLGQKGLVRKGFVWLCPEEVKLIEGLASLKSLEKSYKDSRTKIDAGLKKDAATKAALAQARAEYEKKKLFLEQNPNLPDQQFNAIAADVNKLANLVNTYLPQVVDLDSPEEIPTFKKLFLEMIDHRNKLLLTVLAIRPHVDQLETYYAKIAEDKEVGEALKTLGPQWKLGPAKNYSRDLKPLESAEALVLTDDTPIFREDRALQLSLILNDATPVILGYTTQAEYSVLSADKAKEMGLKIDDNAPQVNLDTEGGRQLMARKIKIPSLRIGKHVLKDVEVLVLPPDAVLFPTYLGTGAFKDLNYTIVRDEFRFLIRPAAGAAPAEKTKKKKSQ